MKKKTAAAIGFLGAAHQQSKESASTPPALRTLRVDIISATSLLDTAMWHLQKQFILGSLKFRLSPVHVQQVTGVALVGFLGRPIQDAYRGSAEEFDSVKWIERLPVRFEWLAAA